MTQRSSSRLPAAASATPRFTPMGKGDTPPQDSPGGAFASLMERGAEEILAVTYWFEPASQPAPYAMAVRFSGRRVDVEGPFQPGDRFVHEETIAQVVPGSGPIAVTARIHGINPGDWAVTAQAQGMTRSVRGRRERSNMPLVARSGIAASELPLLPRIWRKWTPVVGPSLDEAEPTHTHLAPFAAAPGIIPGIWGVLVGLGMVVALLVQGLVIARDRLTVGPALPATLGAIAVGVAGAKLWYIVKKRREHLFEGWCIQGFITGASAAALVLFTVLRMPVGAVLDVTAPGLLLGMAVGRVGCFLAGCCGGPPTSARWGVWSSDQRVGARRVPTQLIESLASLLLGLLLLVTALSHGPAGGALFAAAWAAYILVREGILRMRAEPRQTRWNSTVAAALATVVLVASIVVIAR